MRSVNTISVCFRKWEKSGFLQRKPLSDFLLQGTDLRLIAKAEVTDSS